MRQAHTLALLLAALGGAAALAACDRRPSGGPAAQASSPSASATPVPAVPIVAWSEPVRAEAIAAGRAVLERHQCVRCHTIDDLPAAARPLACTSCHIFLKDLKPEDRQRKSMVAKYGEEIISRYQRNIQHLIEVPSLTGIARRVSPFFLRAFLEAPFDLRPGLGESMIRHGLGPDELRAVVRYFAAVARAEDPYRDGASPPPLPPRPSDERLARGRAKFQEKACATCHAFGNVDFGVTVDALEKAGPAAKLAPNLRFTRERTTPAALVAWIRDPAKLLPGTSMPTLGISEEDAELIAGFLLYGDPKLLPEAPPPASAPPKILERPVSYEEMKEEVLGRTCVHCHMNDHEKDPGPGNKGGLGYKGLSLQMRTYETLVFGMVGPDGERRSVLEKRRGEALPRLVQVMLDRRAEEPRDHVAYGEDRARPPYPRGSLGMPLGLPSMTDAQISLVATWIAQGCKGPTKVTGMPGVDDGYLVPDGPIAKNQGCELRAPLAKRPAWAVDAAPKPATSK